MAYRAFHRPLIAGVALAGASAITFAAVPALPGEKVVAAPSVVMEQTHTVALTGFAEVLTSVVNAMQESGDALVNTSPALYWQVHEQWPDPELLPWNYALFTDIFLAPLAPLVIGPVNDAVAQAVGEVFPGQAELILRVPELIEYAVIRAVGPLLSAVGGAGAAHEQIFQSMTTLEIAPFIEAVFAAPGHVIDGFLNGGYGDLRPLLTGEVGGAPIPAPGLLTPWGADPVQRYADDNAPLVESKLAAGAQEDAATVAGQSETVPAAAPVPTATQQLSSTAAADELSANEFTPSRTGIRQELRELSTSARDGVSLSAVESSTGDSAVGDRAGFSGATGSGAGGSGATDAEPSRSASADVGGSAETANRGGRGTAGDDAA